MMFDSTPTLKIWKRNETIALIALFESEKCLYDKKDPKYHHAEERNEAYSRIHKIMQRIDHGCTLLQIKNRLTYLRSKFTSEIRRKSMAIKSGVVTKESYKPTLWYFELLNFLDDFIRPSKTNKIKNHENEVSSRTQNSKDKESKSVLDMQDRISLINNESTFKSSHKADCSSQSSHNSLLAEPQNEASSSNGVLHEKSTDCENGHEGRNRKRIRLNCSTASEVTAVPEQMPALQSNHREDIFGQYVATEMKTLRDNPVLYLQTKQAILEILTSANFELISPD